LWIGQSFGKIRHVNLRNRSIETLRTSQPLADIGQIAIEKPGSLLAIETNANRIKRIRTKDGLVSIVAGSGKRSFSGDAGSASNADLNAPSSVALDQLGNIFIADTGNNRIRKIDAASHVITTVAGDGTQDREIRDGPALQVGLFLPENVVLDKQGNVLFTDGYFDSPRIRRLRLNSGLIETLFGPSDLRMPRIGNDPVVPQFLILDSNDNFVFVGNEDYVFRIAKGSKSLEFLAGAVRGFIGDGSISTETEFMGAGGIAITDSGDLFIADQRGNRVRRVDAKTKIVSTIAGNGQSEIGFVE
jgi:sugar lactone lactonase YvrE